MDKHSSLKPVTKQDKKMSVRHHLDSIKYNEAHAKDHLAAMKKHMKAMRAMGKKVPAKLKGMKF